MAAKVYLIRHGETAGAETMRYKGHIDVPLSENGVGQIKRLSAFLSGEAGKRGSAEVKGISGTLGAVYCSGLGRAVKSAEIIAEPYGLKPIVVEDFKERNFGVWEGMSFDEIQEKYPDAFTAWAENPLKFSPMEGESTLDVRERALKVFNEITGKHNGDSIAIVAHGGINRVILCELMGIPLENIFRIEQDFAALNVIELWDYPVVKHLNYIV
jgi:alpha-ribazole phosphatase/probable phosphoglycerate mutase